MLVHNRSTTGVLLAVAGAMVLLGFGCKAPERTIPAAENGENTPVAQSGDTEDEGTTDVSTVAWTTYESPTLGIRVPYPEGWYVEEGANNESVDFYPAQPPEYSDEPSEAWLERESGTVDSALANVHVISREPTTRDGRTMTKAVFLEDFYQANPNVLLYLWESNGYVYQIGGPNHGLVEDMIARLEVLQ